jgi:DNA-binding MarR family transcriptional regulator
MSIEITTHGCKFTLANTYVVNDYSYLQCVSNNNLSDSQKTALDLHNRGLNVMPLPRPQDVNLYYGKRTNKKPPYLKKPFFTSRLHVCTPECYRQNPKGCLPEEQRIESLFYRANVGEMVGRTSDNLFALDCDDINTYEYVKKYLIDFGVFYWEYESFRGGVFLMRCKEGIVKNGKGNSPKLDILGNNNYVVLPPSVHPTGVFYQWVIPPGPEGEKPPLVSVVQLEQLGVQLDKGKFTKKELYGLPEVCECLSRKNREYLANGTDEGNRNNAFVSVSCDLSGNNIGFDISRKLILEMGEKCNPPYPRDEILSCLNWAYNGDFEPARQFSKSNNYQLAQQFCDSFDWRVQERTAQTDRAVFQACILRSMVEGAKFRASCREIAELANRTKNTVKQSLDRLMSLDFLIEINKSEKAKRTARIFRFGPKVLKGNDKVFTNRYSIIPPCSDNVSNSEHNNQSLMSNQRKAYLDVFKKLGKVADRVYIHLLDNPEPSIRAIARATKQHPSSVFYAVKRLEKNGFVYKEPDDSLYHANIQNIDELELLAGQLGTLGKTNRKKNMYRYERERWVNRQIADKRFYWKLRISRMVNFHKERKK